MRGLVKESTKKVFQDGSVVGAKSFRISLCVFQP